MDQTSEILDGNTVGGEVMSGGSTYEKIEKARLLSSSEYTVNSAMGYISLKSTRCLP